MNKEEIQALLLRYQMNQCTQEEISKIHTWYQTLNQDSILSLEAQEAQILEERLLKNLLTGIKAEKDERTGLIRPKWWKSPIWYSGIAAALVLSLSYILFFSSENVHTTTASEALFVKTDRENLIHHENKTGKPERIELEDRSVVTLAPGSRMTYPIHFSMGTRDVQLTGDAFFEIAKNPEKPFLVYSGKLITKVLGTSFKIITHSKDKVLDVEVVTGKVSVFENKEAFNRSDLNGSTLKNNNGVILTPNQRVTYFSESRHLMTGLVEEPVKIISSVPVKPKLSYNNTSLPEIVEQLESEYGIEIVFANDRLEKCTFTGDLSDIPLYEKVDLICKSNEASFEIKGTRILINGAGCE